MYLFSPAMQAFSNHILSILWLKTQMQIQKVPACLIYEKMIKRLPLKNANFCLIFIRKSSNRSTSHI